MKNYLALLLSVVVLSACGGGFQAAGDLAQGRQALFRGDNPTALGYFQMAAQTDPNYMFGTDREEGVYSYLGRAQYLNGQYAQARQSLEQDLAQHPRNSLSRLYLGLTLARLNDRPAGQRDITAGLTGIRDYINSVTSTAGDVRRFWDRYRQIRDAIAQALAMIEQPNLNWDSLLNFCERIANAWEQEPDFTLQSPEATRPYNLTP